MRPVDRTTAKRLVYLYLLNVEIAEPYHMVISRLFEHLEFDDSRDIRNTEEYGSTTVSKSNKGGDFVCFVRYDTWRTTGIRKNTVNLLGKILHHFLDEVNIMINQTQNDNMFVTYETIRNFIKPFIFCILERKGIEVDDIIY